MKFFSFTTLYYNRNYNRLFAHLKNRKEIQNRKQKKKIKK